MLRFETDGGRVAGAEVVGVVEEEEEVEARILRRLKRPMVND